MSLKSTHSQRLENWLGKEQVESISRSMKQHRGRPIAMSGVPGIVYATSDGDFVGPIQGGYFGNLLQFGYEQIDRIFKRWERKQIGKLNAGFASLSDLISEATVNSKTQHGIYWSKSATTATTAGNAFSHFNVGTWPPASGVGGTSGTGRKCIRTTTGALGQANATGGDYLHLVRLEWQASVVNSIMLVDRLWDMTYNHATSTSTAVDANNRPDRYQTAALAPGNFISGEITTALSATAHNLTVTYVDDAGNTAEAAAAYAAPVSAVAGRSPTVAGLWQVPLNTGDRGARYITNIAQSTITSVTGVTTWWIAAPLAWVPMAVANMPYVYDGIYSAFNLERIYDDACLALYTPAIASTSSWTHTGSIKMVSG